MPDQGESEHTAVPIEEATTAPENAATGQSEEKFQFFVYIIESPSAPDLYHGRSESVLLAQAVALDQIPCVTKTAINPAAFVAALKLGLPNAMSQHPDRLPILHISAHGSKDGIQLSSGDVITWTSLRELLMPVNKSLSGSLLLCMSACEGYGACHMAMELNTAEHPYFALVANWGQPTWSDTAVAYAVFYHLVAKGITIVEAVEAMRHATNDQKWVSELAQESQQTYADHVAKVYLPAAQESLEEAAESVEIPADAKALETPTPEG
jgi:hypothetical protein